MTPSHAFPSATGRSALPGRLVIDADLHLEIDGSPVTVTADGGPVVVRLTDAATVLSAAADLPSPARSPRRLSRTLRHVQDSGVRVEVVDERGPLVTFGSVETRGGVAGTVLGRVPVRVHDVRIVRLVASELLRRVTRRGRQLRWDRRRR